MSTLTPRKLRTVKYLQEFLQMQKPSIRLTRVDGKNLFNYESSRLTISEDIDEKDKNDLTASIDRAGARIPYRCELYPSTQSQSSEKQKKLGVMYSNLDRSYTGVPPFPDWFTDWVYGRIVAPDTGIILNHYLSEVLLPRLTTQKLNIQIPHLVILELEARANRNKKAKRLSISAFHEIRRLRLEARASRFSHPLDPSILTNVSLISGKRKMDEFIRREIRDQNGWKGIPKWNDQIVLLTRDLMMASAASAEDIDAFYLCPANPETTEFFVDVSTLAKIILETAVTLENVCIEELFEGRSMICEGIWSGKTVMDWYKKRFRSYFIKH